LRASMLCNTTIIRYLNKPTQSKTQLTQEVVNSFNTYYTRATKVIYTDSCSGSSCTTNFTAPIFDQQGNPDMFYDPINLGFELPEGTPYQYKTFDWSVSYPNPNP
jgi:hypothetical protein